MRQVLAGMIGPWAGALAALTLLLGLGAEPARATEVEVATPAALAAALEGAGPGTVIRLAPGDYGALAARRLSGGPGAPVVLRSADPERPARFAALDLRQVAHVELRALAFDYARGPDDPSWFRPFQVHNSQDVAIADSLFDGDRGSSGYPTGFGLRVVGIEGFRFEGNEVRGFYRGLSVNRSRDVLVRGNDLHSLRMDGMNFAQVSEVLIEGNHIHDFERAVDSGDHADMIQFWTNQTDQPSSDVVIRGNLLNSGRGWFTQSIFMRNEEVDQGRAGREMFYRNIRIEQNVIINAHAHGITVGEADGLVIANNSILRNAASEGGRGAPGARPAENRRDAPALWTPRINVARASTDVRIERNVVAGIRGGIEGEGEHRPGWVVADNLLVQDRRPSAPGFYGSVFAGMPGGDPGDPQSFAPRPGGPLDGTNLGAPMLAQGGL